VYLVDYDPAKHDTIPSLPRAELERIKALGVRVVAPPMPALLAVENGRVVPSALAKTLKEMAENSTFFFRDVTTYDEKAAKKNLTPEAAPLLKTTRERMAALESWAAPRLHEVIQAVAAEAGAGLGKVAQPVRVAVSGGSVSPPIDVTLEILGRGTTLQRLDRAIAHCG
jgi:glutamyl-tRNA synthetase